MNMLLQRLIAIIFCCSYLAALAQINQLQIKPTAFASYTLTNDCNVIEHPSGTKIIVPKNAFSCKEGVKLKFREFRDPYDMVINRITMQVTRNGQRRQLESGGMFEIRAFCDGIEIKLNPGKNIQERYKCEKHVDELEVYKMDEKKQWALYNLPIMEMSFDPTNNSSSRSDLWGNESILDQEQTIEQQYNDDGIIWEGERAANNNFEPFPYFDGIYKGVNVFEMGLYNYDALLSEEDAIPLEAIVEIKGMPDLQVDDLYVVYDSLNTSYLYSKYDFKEKFAIKANRKATIFAVLKDGLIASFPVAKFIAINWENFRNGKFTFQLELDPVAPTKKEELP